MSGLLSVILDWSEVWALLIPLLVLMFRHRQSSMLSPVIVYLCLALALNLFADIIAGFKQPYHFPAWLQSNNPVYNIHSVVRFACFGYFLISLPQHAFKTGKKVIVVIFALFVMINFILFEKFFYYAHLSGNLLSAEAYLLLIYCMLYYLTVLNNEEQIISKDPAFWIATGLSIYVVVNFFVFLFYVPMIAQNPVLAMDIWNVHNIAYIILCLFITRALYAPAGN
jgi:hypothetical protein